MGDTTGTGTAEATTHVAVPATTPITIIEPKRFNLDLLTRDRLGIQYWIEGFCQR